jgi:hypothetical protein
MPSFLHRLERVFGRLAIPNLSLVIVTGQVAVFALALLNRISLGPFILMPVLVLHGQPWRLLTFIFMPPFVPLSWWPLLLCGWWMFYAMGTALEDYWGVFRYNVFLFAGWALSIGAAFLAPWVAVDASFFLGSVFLAFAYLNPDFVIQILLVLPVQIKWLARLTWVLYAVEFVRGVPAVRLQILAATVNFFLFFGRDIFLTARLRRRRITGVAQRLAGSGAEAEARHRCRICGKTELTHPQLDFRYCSKCAGEQCYCSEHIFNHEHLLTDEKAKV